MTTTAGELHQAAVVAANRGEYGAARRLLDRAERRAADPDLIARILGTRAFVVARSGDVARGEEICLQALAVEGIGAETFAVLAGQMGSLAEHAGHLGDAERWLTRGIDALEGESKELANLVVNRSLVRMQRRQLEAASRDAQHATRLLGAVGDAADEAQAVHNEGYIALLRGELVRAMHLMARARPALEEMSPVAAGISDVDRAEVLRDAGLVTEAERLLARAADLFGAHRMPHDRAQAEFNLARSLLTHDATAAGERAAAARRRFRRQGNETWALRAESIEMRAAFLSARPDGRGRRGVPRADAVDAVASALDAAGYRNDAAGLRLSAALWRARSGVPDATPARSAPTASLDVRLLAHEVRAARAASRGRRGEALRHAASGLEALAAWRRDFGSLDLQTSTAMHGTGLMWSGLAGAVESGRPDVVFAWSERARHYSLQVVPLRPPPDPAVADELAELRMLRADAGDARLGARVAELEAAARQRQWAGTASSAVEERVSLDQMSGALDDDTAYIGYVLTEHRLVALVATRGAATIVPLPEWSSAPPLLAGLRADVDMAASVRTGPMAAVVRIALDDRLKRLSAVLLRDPLRVAGDRRLVLTAPGALSGMPWSLLPGMLGRTFTLAGSASRWLRRRAPIERPREVGLVVGPRVARGQEEVDAAASTWPAARALSGSAATVDAVADLASTVDLLHIAAHGRHAVDNPLFSGLDLADGALFGYDIDRMPRLPATVVLSACEVGRSSVRWGEEAVGMTRIWLHAGTRTVIAAPVVVADDVACELLGAMHAGLSAGLPPAEALAAASADTGIVAPFQSHGAGF